MPTTIVTTDIGYNDNQTTYRFAVNTTVTTYQFQRTQESLYVSNDGVYPVHITLHNGGLIWECDLQAGEEKLFNDLILLSFDISTSTGTSTVSLLSKNLVESDNGATKLDLSFIQNKGIDLKNASYTWWTSHAIRITNKKDRTYIGFVDDIGQQGICAVDNETGDIERVILAKFEQDDHNPIGITYDDSYRIMVVYARHNLDNVHRYRLSNTPESLDFGEEFTITSPGTSTVVTYSQVHKSTTGIHLFYRSASDKAYWCYRRYLFANDYWEDEIKLFWDSSPYMKSIQRSDVVATIRFVLYNHPIFSSNHSIYACYLDISTGNLYNPAVPSAELIGNIFSDDWEAVRVKDSVKEAYAPTGDEITRLLDVNYSTTWQFAFVEFTDETDGVYKFSKYNSSSGEFDTYSTGINSGISIDTIQGNNWYFGGIALVNNAYEMYISRESSGTWYIEKYSSSDTGVTWTKDLEIETSSTKKLFRPIVPINFSSNFPVMYLKGTFGSYLDYYVDIIKYGVTASIDNDAQSTNYNTQTSSIGIGALSGVIDNSVMEVTLNGLALTNICTNGAFITNTTGWTATNGAISRLTGPTRGKLLGNAAETSMYVDFDTAIACADEKKIFVRAKLRPSTTGLGNFKVQILGTTGGDAIDVATMTDPANSIYYNVYGSVTLDATYTGDIKIRVYVDDLDGTTNSKSIDIMDVVCIDMTVDAVTSYTDSELFYSSVGYFDGSANVTNPIIRSTGKNIFKLPYTSTGFDYNQNTISFDGTKYTYTGLADSQRLSSKKIYVRAGTSYKVYVDGYRDATANGKFDIVYFQDGGTYITAVQVGTTRSISTLTFTAPITGFMYLRLIPTSSGAPASGSPDIRMYIYSVMVCESSYTSDYEDCKESNLELIGNFITGDTIERINGEWYKLSSGVYTKISTKGTLMAYENGTLSIENSNIIPEIVLTYPINTKASEDYAINTINQLSQKVGNWKDWTPTLTWTTGTPATDVVTTAKYVVIGKLCYFTLYYKASDGNGATALTVTLPVTAYDKAGSQPASCNAQQKVDTTWTNPLAYIDDDNNLLKFRSLATVTDTNAVELLVTGFFEVA
jgi:hypothetical protein